MRQDSVGLTHRCNLQRVAPVLENRPRGFPKSVIIQKYPLMFGNGYVFEEFLRLSFTRERLRRSALMDIYLNGQ